MEIVFNEDDLRAYMTDAVKVSNESPVLLDRFLDDAIEVDVDAVCDGRHVLVGGIMEHVEQAGVHSGDSGCSLPPNSLSAELQDALREQTDALASDDLSRFEAMLATQAHTLDALGHYLARRSMSNASEGYLV
jgi:carbamoyl-phosphate synthase large subunit